MFDQPPATRLALLEFLPSAMAARREIANGFQPTTRAEVEAHVLTKTGSKEAAESAGLAWHQSQAMAGVPLT